MATAATGAKLGCANRWQIMDQELTQCLEMKFTEIHEKIAGLDSNFATKQDLERVETTLLTEFHKWASPRGGRGREPTRLPFERLTWRWNR